MSAAVAVGATNIVGHIRRATAGADLSAQDMREAFDAIMDGHAGEAQTAALLVALALKGETADELAGAAEAMRARAVRVHSRRTLVVDVCGTGGDGGGTFNISTAVAFVVAGAGVAVAKHGNRAMSSRCGSADVLEFLGVRIGLPPERTAHILDAHGIAFMFAQTHHPAMRNVAPVRRAIGVRTVFNLLGPLCNPAGAQRQVVGVAAPGALRCVAECMGRLGSQRAAAVHGCDGLDEATLAGTTRVVEWTGGEIIEHDIRPEDVGLARAGSDALRGGDAAANAAAIRSVLDARPGPRLDVVLLNAALALYIAGAATTLREGARQARTSIDSGAAAAKLSALVEASQA